MYGLELAVQTAPLSRSPAVTWVSAFAIGMNKTKGIAPNNILHKNEIFLRINDSYELIMPTGYQRGDKETLKKFSRNDEDLIKKR